MHEASPDPEKLRRAHPLAIALIARLRAKPDARILEIGTGSGRNSDALRAAGFSIETVADGAFDGALSTHALLHGTPGTVAAMLQQIAHALKPNAPFHATFGSTHDARFGKGKRISKHVYAPTGGDEVGVPHVFFTRDELVALLSVSFEVESIDETNADQIIGRWAHKEPPRGVMHWFVRATKKAR